MSIYVSIKVSGLVEVLLFISTLNLKKEPETYKFGMYQYLLSLPSLKLCTSTELNKYYKSYEHLCVDKGV